MYYGEKTDVTLSFPKELLDIVVERFGDIPISRLCSCEEIGIIKNDKTGRKIITLKEWEKDYDKYAKKLIKKGLF